VWFYGSQSLLGSGTIEFADDTPYNRLFLNGQGYGATLTVGPKLTLHGRGSITGYNVSDRLINQGTIMADVTGQTLTVSFTKWTNGGVLKARNGGTLYLGGEFNQQGKSAFDSNGGTIQIAGTLDNTGSTMDLNVGADALMLTGTIKSGTVTNSGGGGLLTPSGTLDGVTLISDLTIPNGAVLTIRNGLTINGTLTLGSSNAWTELHFMGTQGLLGTGQVVLGKTGPYNRICSRGDGGSNPATLTIGPGITIQTSLGGFLGNYQGNDSQVNQRTIVAEGSETSLTINGLAWVNSRAIACSCNLIGR